MQEIQHVCTSLVVRSAASSLIQPAPGRSGLFIMEVMGVHRHWKVFHLRTEKETFQNRVKISLGLDRSGCGGGFFGAKLS